MLPSLSLAAPAYNEESCIREILLDWIKYLQVNNIASSWEINICNDGSTDKTLKILNEIKNQFPGYINILNFEKNQGAAAALSEAIMSSKFEWTLLLDSDGQFPIQNIKKFMNVDDYSKEVGFKGQRVVKKDDLFMRFGSFISGRILNLIYTNSYSDFNSAFMLIRTDVLQSIRLEAKGLNYSTDITGKLAEKNIFLREIRIEQREREESVSTKKALRSAIHRFLFVLYLMCRKLLLNLGVLRN